MKLTAFATLNNNKVCNKTLRTPDLNLLAKLDAMGVTLDDPMPRSVTNQVSGFSGLLHPLIATLVEWVYETYSTYDFTGAMNYHGTKIAIGTFDRVRHLVLALDAKAYSDFLD